MASPVILFGNEAARLPDMTAPQLNITQIPPQQRTAEGQAASLFRNSAGDPPNLSYTPVEDNDPLGKLSQSGVPSGTLASVRQPAMGGYSYPGTGLGVSGYSSWNSGNPSDVDYLRQLVESGGSMYNFTTPQWQQMVNAQQRGLQSNYANMMEGFNASGNFPSSAFGNAAVDYWSQASKDQNSLLAQLSNTAWENAAGRVSTGANTLAGLGYNWAGQQSEQAFQDYLTQLNQAFQGSQTMYQGGLSTSQLLAQLGAQGASQLLQGSITGAGQLYSTENEAAMAEMQRQLALQQMGMTGAVNLGNLSNANLALGSQLGGQQQATLQDQINRAYQEWMRTQAAYNPLIPYMQQGATAYPSMAYPSYAPSQLGQIMGSAGSILGSVPWSQIFQAVGWGDSASNSGGWGGSGGNWGGWSDYANYINNVYNYPSYTY